MQFICDYTSWLPASHRRVRHAYALQISVFPPKKESILQAEVKATPHTPFLSISIAISKPSFVAWGVAFTSHFPPLLIY